MYNFYNVYRRDFFWTLEKRVFRYRLATVDCEDLCLRQIAHEKLGSQTQKVRIPILENIEPKVQKPIGQDQDNLPV